MKHKYWSVLETEYTTTINEILKVSVQYHISDEYQKSETLWWNIQLHVYNIW